MSYAGTEKSRIEIDGREEKDGSTIEEPAAEIRSTIEGPEEEVGGQMAEKDKNIFLLFKN